MNHKFLNSTSSRPNCWNGNIYLKRAVDLCHFIENTAKFFVVFMTETNRLERGHLTYSLLGKARCIKL